MCQSQGLSTAAASTADTMDSGGSTTPEHRVKRTADAPWEPASAQEAAEFRAHNEALAEEARAQEEADRLAYSQHESAMARQWDEWALSSETCNPEVNPSRKRIRVTICVGTGSGHEIGQASVEGVINHDQQATVTFNVVETLAGGLNDGAANEAMEIDRGLQRDAAQANPSACQLREGPPAWTGRDCQ